MNQASTVPSELRLQDTKEASDVFEPTDPVSAEDVISKLSLDDCRVYSLLSSIGSNWVDLDIVVEVGEELGRHGALDGGRDDILSTIEKLRQGGLVEFMKGCANDAIRATPGHMLSPAWKHPNEKRYYDMGRRMLFVGAGLVHGLTDLKAHMGGCMKMARGLGGESELKISEEIWNTLSAGLCILSRVQSAYGNDGVALELHMMSLGYKSSPSEIDGRKSSDFTEGSEFQMKLCSFCAESNGKEEEEIGLYSGRRWIGGEFMEFEKEGVEVQSEE